MPGWPIGRVADSVQQLHQPEEAEEGVNRDQHHDSVRGATMARLFRRPGFAGIAQVPGFAPFAPEYRNQCQAEQTSAGVKTSRAGRHQRTGQGETLSSAAMQCIGGEATENEEPCQNVESFPVPLMSGDLCLSLLSLEQLATLTPSVLTHHPTNHGERGDWMEEQDDDVDGVHMRPRR